MGKYKHMLPCYWVCESLQLQIAPSARIAVAQDIVYPNPFRRLPSDPGGLHIEHLIKFHVISMHVGIGAPVA